MPHPGHFIMGYACGFRLNTYVNGYIVSTVGELKYPMDKDADKWRPLGADKDSLYESMVFHAVKDQSKCCPYRQESGEDLEMRRYAKADDAYEGHMKLIEEYANK
jgi:hypothetical protein